MLYKFDELNKYVLFQLPKLMPDEVGGHEVAWENIFSAWSKVMPISPSTIATGIKRQRPWKYKLITRFDKRINSQMRVIYRNEILQIDHVINVEEQNIFLEIYVIKQGNYELNNTN